MRLRLLLLIPIIFLLSTTSALTNLSLEILRPELHQHRFPISVYKDRVRPKAALFPPRTSVGIAEAWEHAPKLLSKLIQNYWISSSNLNVVFNEVPVAHTEVHSTGFFIRIHRARSARAPPFLA